MSLTPSVLLKEIEQRKFRPVYLLHGDEPFFLDQIADALEASVVPESSKGFCQFILYGAEHDLGAVIQHARSYPFMSDRQLVLVREAQRMEGLKKLEGQELLEAYAEKPLQSTVLVLVYHGKIDERKGFAKAIAANGALLKSSKMYDNKIPDWVVSHCRDRQVKITPAAVQMIVENIGNDLKRIHNEIQKVLVNLAPGEGIDVDQVEKFIGISKEYNVFELQKALGVKDVRKASKITEFFAAHTKDIPLVQTLPTLYNYFSKVLLAHASADKSDQGLAAVLGVNPYFVKDYKAGMANYSVPKLAKIIGYLREADARGKGIEVGSLTHSDIFRDLIFKILH